MAGVISMMASRYRPRKRKKADCATGSCITKFFRVATPTTEAPTPEAGSGSMSSSSDPDHVSTHSEPEDTGGGDDDAGPTQVEQHSGVQPDSDDSDSINDLGLILRESLTVSEVSRAISGLTPGQKYTLLMEHYKPDRSFIFPKVHSNGCHRSFQQKWLDRYPWLVYSKEVDGGFCKFCSLFAKNRSTLGVLVNKSFRRWVKVNKLWMVMHQISTMLMLLRLH